MSLEEDAEKFGAEIQKAMTRATQGHPDVLVFALRGTEIRDLLLEMAVSAEESISRLEVDKVVPIRRPMPIPPGYPPLPFEGHFPEAQEEHRKRQTELLRQSAKKYRFLAAHIEEDRFFKLSVPDLGFLGLVPYFTSSGLGC
jgi:hypothetical protein